MRSSREPLIPLNTAKLLFFFHIPFTQPYFFCFRTAKILCFHAKKHEAQGPGYFFSFSPTVRIAA